MGHDDGLYIVCLFVMSVMSPGSHKWVAFAHQSDQDDILCICVSPPVTYCQLGFEGLESPKCDVPLELPSDGLRPPDAKSLLLDFDLLVGKMVIIWDGKG